jgi:hypothetical protein
LSVTVLPESMREELNQARERVRSMLSERAQLKKHDKTLAMPSTYWSDFCSYFDYLLDLSPESLARIRLHTYHLTGDTYQTFYFQVGADAMLASWRQLVRGVPEEFVLSEPPGGLGFEVDDGTRRVNWDIYRAQMALNYLMRNWKPVPEVRSSPHRSLFLEIGAGYASTGYHLQRTYRNVGYIIVDLPETLLFSATYLTVLHGGGRLYVYRAGDDLQALLEPTRVNDYDFILIPNYHLQTLRHLRFDVAINVASLQEMRRDQAEVYLDFIRDVCQGMFYYHNQDRQPHNLEIQDLSECLRSRFSAVEIGAEENTGAFAIARAHRLLRSSLRNLAVHMGLAEPIEKNLLNALPYRTFVCRPLRTGASHASQGQKAY